MGGHVFCAHAQIIMLNRAHPSGIREDEFFCQSLCKNVEVTVQAAILRAGRDAGGGSEGAIRPLRFLH